MDRTLETAGCKSRSEFLEKAALLYAGYVSGQDACEFLPAALTDALRSTVHDSENRTCRLLFKLAVELDMVMNVLAAGMEILQEDLDRLRGRCVREVKSTKWVELIKQFSSPTELTADMLNTLIEKILVHEATKDEDGNRVQEIEIVYRFVGKID